MRVLLVVLQLLARRLVDVAPAADEVLHGLGGHVGVHLVAQQQYEIRPQSGLLAQRQSEGAHRVHAVTAIARLVVIDTRAARSPGHPERALRGESGDHRCRQRRIRLGPHLLAVHPDLVGQHRSGGEVGQLHEGVVVVMHGERARAPLAAIDPDAHFCGRVGLHPDRRARLVGVAQHRSEDERG